MIINISQKEVLCKRKEECKTLWSKASGLMFRPPLKDHALVFYFSKEQINSLHMLFVFQTIDVLFLDKDCIVVERARLRPFTFYLPKQKSQYVIELPDAKTTQIGDTISL